MVCEFSSADVLMVKKLIVLSETEFYYRAEINPECCSGRKQCSETRPFLTGWQTGVDARLNQPKVVYTIRTVSNKRDLLGSLYGKNSARVIKPFAFIHSLEPEAYLKYYADEHSYMANLFVQPSVQRLTACLIAPPSSLIQPPREASATPPPQPLPQVQQGSEKAAAAATAFDGVWSVAKKYSLGTGGKAQSRIQGTLSEPTQQQQMQHQAASGAKRTASNLSQQVDLLTNGRARGDIPGDRKSDSLSLISAEQAGTSTTSQAPHQPPQPPRRVSTPDRARERDFTCAGFAPALSRRLELLAAVEAAAEAAAARQVSEGSADQQLTV